MTNVFLLKFSYSALLRWRPWTVFPFTVYLSVDWLPLNPVTTQPSLVRYATTFDFGLGDRLCDGLLLLGLCLETGLALDGLGVRLTDIGLILRGLLLTERDFVKTRLVGLLLTDLLTNLPVGLLLITLLGLGLLLTDLLTDRDLEKGRTRLGGLLLLDFAVVTRRDGLLLLLIGLLVGLIPLVGLALLTNPTVEE